MRTEELKKSYEKFGPIYPVLVDKHGNVIDGFHRKKVDPNWPVMKREDIETEYDREKIALLANLLRREITGEEITKRLTKLADFWMKKGYKKGQIVQKLYEELGGVWSDDWIRKYLPEKFKAEEKIKAAKESARQRRALPPETFIYNVWWSSGKREEGYGDPNFHGNTPPIIIKECLLKYTNENDLVLDPMAGSGTTIDVCNKLKRRCLAFDIKPIREDIKFADAEKIPVERCSVDFVFAHWPYWNMVKYSDRKDDLSNMSLSQFYEKSERIIKKIYEILKPNKYFALLIGDRRKQQQLLDLSAKLSEIGSKYFLLFDKIIWIAKDQRSLKKISSFNLTRWRAKTHGYHIQTFDVLLIFKKV
jgi:DNA modification methylase